MDETGSQKSGGLRRNSVSINNLAMMKKISDHHINSPKKLSKNNHN